MWMQGVIAARYSFTSCRRPSQIIWGLTGRAACDSSPRPPVQPQPKWYPESGSSPERHWCHEKPPTVKSKFPFHPFEDGQPKQVVILSYQRCGSTFFGEIFNENPAAFYMFEPLDSLYSSMYGTKKGWNIPTDITIYPNGSQRILPQEEKITVSQFLFNLLTCNVDSLPTATLVHRYYLQFTRESINTSKYVQCASKLRLSISMCNGRTPWKYCGHRLGNRSEEMLSDCRRALSDPEYRKTHPNGSLFDRYVGCMKKIRGTFDKNCTMIWKSNCTSRSLRAVKLVRGTMDGLEPLLRALPNLRVIHLIREPRAVILSRSMLSSGVRGLFSGLNENHTMAREAYLYCKTVVTDVRRRAELEAIYPGKIFPIIYDDLVGNVRGYINDVYGFLGMSAPEEVFRWLRNSKSPKRYGDQLSSSAIANRWQNVLTVIQSKEIETVCKEFYQVVKYNWVNLHV